MTDPIATPPNWSRPQDLNLREVSGSATARRDLAAQLRKLAASETERTDRSGRKLAPRAGVGDGDQNGVVQTAINVLEGRRVVNEDNRGGTFTKGAIGDFQRRFMGRAAVDRVAGRDTYLAMAAALENGTTPTKFVRRAEPERPAARHGIRVGAAEPRPAAVRAEPVATPRDRSAEIVGNLQTALQSPDAATRAAAMRQPLQDVEALQGADRTRAIQGMRDQMLAGGPDAAVERARALTAANPQSVQARSELLAAMRRAGDNPGAPAPLSGQDVERIRGDETPRTGAGRFAPVSPLERPVDDALATPRTIGNDAVGALRSADPDRNARIGAQLDRIQQLPEAERDQAAGRIADAIRQAPAHERADITARLLDASGGDNLDARQSVLERLSPEERWLATEAYARANPDMVTARPDIANLATLYDKPESLQRVDAAVESLRAAQNLRALETPGGDPRAAIAAAGLEARRNLEAALALEGPARDAALAHFTASLAATPGGHPDPALLSSMIIDGQLDGRGANAVANAVWPRLDDAGRKQVARSMAEALEAEGQSPMARNFPRVAALVGDRSVDPVRPQAVPDVMKDAVAAERTAVKREHFDALYERTGGPLADLDPLIGLGAQGLAGLGARLFSRSAAPVAQVANATRGSLRDALSAAARETEKLGRIPASPAVTPLGSRVVHSPYGAFVSIAPSLGKPIPQAAVARMEQVSRTIASYRGAGQAEAALALEARYYAIVKELAAARFNLAPLGF